MVTKGGNMDIRSMRLRRLARVSFQLFLFVGSLFMFSSGGESLEPPVIALSLWLYLIVSGVLKTAVRTAQENSTFLGRIWALFYLLSAIVLVFYIAQIFLNRVIETPDRNPSLSIILLIL